MENKQTAIKWFAIKTLGLQIELRLKKISVFEFENKYNEYLEQAKAMEKEQIKDAFISGENTITMTPEEYYNETYLK